MSALAKIFARKCSAPEKAECAVDIKKLDASMHLLRATTAELSEAAISASNVLREQLENSENRFLSTIDAIDDLVIIKDGDGRWVTVNQVGEKSFSMMSDQYGGKTNQELGTQYPFFRECLEICDKTDNQAWETGSPTRSDEFVPTPDGDIWYDVIKTPVYNQDGSRKELIVVGRDITEHRIHNQRMKACFTALNSASDPIVILDRDGRVFFCNDRFAIVMDANSYVELIGKKLDEILPIKDLFAGMWDELKKNKSWESPTPCIRKKLCKVSVVPVMNGVPDPIHYICTIKQCLKGTGLDVPSCTLFGPTKNPQDNVITSSFLAKDDNHVKTT